MTTAPLDPDAADGYSAILEQALAQIIDVTERFEARKVITQAKNLLMTHQKMTEPEAYRWIQKSAMDRRTPMVLIATSVLEGYGDRTSKAG